MLALLHYFEPSSTVFIYLACFLISKDITQRSVSPNIAASICDKKRRTRQYRHNKATFFLSPCISKVFLSQIFCIPLSKVETLNISTLNFQLF